MNEKEISTNSEGLYPPENLPSLVIYGGGGHGKSIIDLVRSMGKYQIVGVIDDVLSPGSQVLGATVLGNFSAIKDLVARGICLAVNAVGGISDLETRVKIFQQMKDSGFDFPILVHPTATVEPSACLSPGVQILPHAYVGSEASIGFGVIVNSGAIVSHDCQIGEFSGLAPGAMLAGEVRIGDRVQVGMGVTINLRLSVGDGSRIGNSAVIKQDVPANTVVRAGSIWPSQQ